MIIKVLHIITGLGTTGGAETMLYKLIKNTKKDIEHVVISLTEDGAIGEKIKKLNIEVFHLNMTKSFKIINRFINLKKLLTKRIS